MNSDEYWMTLALEQAGKAYDHGEVPVGAVLVHNDQLVACGYNRPISTNDATAHAEMIVLRAAGEMLKNYRLPGAHLYVTVEPCMMCAGALVHARVEKVVYGTAEPKAGVGHSHPLLDSDWLNHNVEIRGGVLASECAAVLTDFFAQRRAHNRRLNKQST